MTNIVPKSVQNYYKNFEPANKSAKKAFLLANMYYGIIVKPLLLCKDYVRTMLGLCKDYVRTM